ncbi:putative quercetin 2,3-dioxygenase [Colletotrichum sp. SAR 10_98]|nr:putative quercetin 2,3-dioxygenase [Colletotrichum sp. SAR 10_98]
MAEVVGIIGSVVGILTAAEVAYNKIKSMKGLPEAFAEVALRMPLTQQILSDIESRSRGAPESTIRVLLPVINSCKGNAEALKTTLEKLGPGDSTTAWNLDKYISLIKSRGKKGRVEDLMKKILQDIYTLASHETINAATSEQLEQLMEAMELVGKAKDSAPDEMLEESGKVSISHGERRLKAFRHLNCASYEDHKNRNLEAMANTCKWFTEHPTYRSWMVSLDESFLWVSADPGCGKSVLARYLIDYELKPSRVIYFFFKDGFDDQDNAESALKCLLHQLLKGNPDLFTEEVLKLLEEMGEKRLKGFSSLWNIFAKVSDEIVDTICVMDALDECETSGWFRMAKALGDLYEKSKTNLRFILLSRPYNEVRRAIRKGRIPHINLRGEDEAEIGKISAEINIVIKQRVEELVLESKLSFEEEEKVVQRLTSFQVSTAPGYYFSP